ncbi:MAG: M48 family metalloprotease [Deltaproteobacteria bacterium]|nr:M48 family metalloprotease [Deltaproteobacteria bacterium]
MDSGRLRGCMVERRPSPFSRPFNRWLAAVLTLSFVGQNARAYSIADEQNLGRKFALEARSRLPLIDDAEINAYVDRIGQKIVKGLGDQPFAYRFFVVRDARINAFAVPGGYVYVNGGLLARASNDDEIAGVLGHEIGHVNAHHLVRQQEATQLLNYSALFGLLLSAVQPALGAGAAAISAAVQLQYRREFEQEADYLGARYMRQAGFEPRGMLDFLKKMMDEQHGAPTSTPYLLSHPLTDTRLTNLEAVLHTHQWDQSPRRPRGLELERVQLLVQARSAPAQDVVTFYRRAAEQAPNDGHAQYLLGLAYLETGVYDSALAAFEKAQALGFDKIDRERGRAALRLRRPDEARRYLLAAVESAPDDPLAHYELAKVLEILNDIEAAAREYERSIELDPMLDVAHYDLGMLAGRSGRPGEGFYHLAVASQLRGELDKALSNFEKAAPLLPAGTSRAEEVQAAIDDLSRFMKSR